MLTAAADYDLCRVNFCVGREGLAAGDGKREKEGRKKEGEREGKREGRGGGRERGRG